MRKVALMTKWLRLELLNGSPDAGNLRVPFVMTAHGADARSRMDLWMNGNLRRVVSATSEAKLRVISHRATRSGKTRAVWVKRRFKLET